MLNKTIFVTSGLFLSCLFTPTLAWAKDVHVSPTGLDTNNGNLNTPYKTIQKALNTVVAGDTVFIRKGTYTSIQGGWIPKNSGTANNPITITNYPNEQVLIKLSTAAEHFGFTCYSTPTWNTPKADFIKIVGTEVTTGITLEGVNTTKGIVMQGDPGTKTETPGIFASDCDSWEIGNIDFFNVGAGVWTHKKTNGQLNTEATVKWHVHDNRVFGFHNESGMQFDGDENVVENNEIYKINNTSTPNGCQIINLVGSKNTVRGNTFSKKGSTQECNGILLEWDLADYNDIQQNTIEGNDIGIHVAGGDHNLIANNLIYTSSATQNFQGINIRSHQNTTSWPCDENSFLIPPNNPAHYDYPHYWTPRNCLSMANLVLNNTISGYKDGIRFFGGLTPDAETKVSNNAISSWSHGSICLYQASTGQCQTVPTVSSEDKNITSGNFGFTNAANGNFSLTAQSPLINAGKSVSQFISKDFKSTARPQGNAFDVGAYEYQAGGANPSATPTSTLTPTTIPLSCPADIDQSGTTDLRDYSILVTNFLKDPPSDPRADIDQNGRIDLLDYSILVRNFLKPCE